MRIRTLIVSAVIITALAACTSAEESNSVQASRVLPQGDAVQLTTASGSTIDHTMEEGLYALMQTSKGSILLNLEFEKTPLTVTNFVGLAEGSISNSRGDGPFYDGLTFHRVIDNFMIQGGDPQGTGSGGPGYRFPDEIRSELRHDSAGILSMANAGPGTNGSQFFITHEPTPWLDGRHTVFGQVVVGQDVVNAIQQGDSIETLSILRVGSDAEAFTASQEDFDRHLAGMQAAAEAEAARAAEQQQAEINQRFPDLQDGEQGIRYRIEQEGNGPKPEAGETVSIHYTGSFVNGQVFDSSLERDPLKFQIQGGQIIPGFDLSVRDMRVGEKRSSVIPPSLAYGSQGAGGVIPPNAYLVFEIELLDIE